MLHTDLIPPVVEHDRATHWYTGLVLHEGFETLVVIAGPVSEEGTSVEERLGEGFQCI